MPTTGRDLRAERRAADITVVDMSARMGLSRQAIHNLERYETPSPTRVEQYRLALRDAIKASQPADAA